MAEFEKTSIPKVHCDHKTQFLWCNDGCWEARGLSSREIESHMLGLKKSIPYLKHWTPVDASDFGRCVKLLNSHPEWKERLGEMTAYGYTWIKLVNNWVNLEIQYNQIPIVLNPSIKALPPDNPLSILNKIALDEFYQELKSLTELNGIIKPYITSDSVKTSELYIGSLVPHPEVEEEVMGLDPFVVFDVEPYVMVPVYKKDSREPTSNHRVKVSLYSKIEDFESLPEDKKSVILSIVDSMNEIVKSNTKFMRTITFNKCPVYKLGTEDTDEMFFANIYDEDICEKIGSGLYLIPKSHPLHPSNLDGEWEKFYEDVNWVVSKNPIKLYELYEEGLINS